MTRERLPDTRQGLTHKLTLRDVAGNKVRIYITVGLYADGRPGELFLTTDDAGDDFAGMLRQWAIAVSLCLQNGVTLDKLVEKFAHQDFPPQGMTGHPEFPTCSSVADYVARWMQARFAPNAGREVGR